MPYPAAPWQMHGQLWVSLFRVRAGDHPDRRPGVYGAALVSYEEPSPLTYSELLVARPVRAAGGRRVEITDIWVDSVDSRDGGRELWAIPKELCDFERTTSGGRLCRTEWSTGLDGRPIARARFTDVSGSMLRTPFRGSTWQQRREPDPRAGEEVVAPLRGTARSLPCRGTWEFDEAGPLGWLAGKRPLASFRMADFAMSFG
ncbi:MAG TPA: acetoacetate decarboxylase family protein [Marmoricola sp.]|nr:acetoacetate decarboxylase family protein [Marmoricola sp.]